MTHRLFTPPAFTAREVAEVIGGKLGRPLPHTEGDADGDGCVDVTTRVHVQVGADYLVVGAWVDATTMKAWPPRRNVPWAFRDLTEALRDFPDEES